MRTFKAIVLAVASTLLVTAVASAAEFFTPAILISAISEDSVQCQLVNVSAQSRTVSIELINESGVVILSGSPIVVAPGHVVVASGGGQQVAGRFVYCHSTVEGVKGNYRGAITRNNNVTGHVLSLPAE